jgi:predicted nuclease of predicted toxin-antitoxin system
LGLRDSRDEEIFQAARAANAVVLTKDADFPLLLDRRGPPPKVLWLTCGNTSKRQLQILLEQALWTAIRLLEPGESLVEIAKVDF